MTEPSEYLRPARQALLWQLRWRRIETVTCAGCLVAAGASLSLFLLGLAVLPTALAIMVLASLSACGWAALARVSYSSAAQYADRRWHLDDLLITAWAIKEEEAAKASSDDPAWRTAFLASAEARCMELQLHRMKWRQLSGDRPLIRPRLWGLCGLGGVLILAIGLWPRSPRKNDSPDLATAQHPTSAEIVMRPAESPQITAPALRPAGNDVSDETPDKPGGTDHTSPPLDDAPSAVDHHSPNNGADNSRSFGAAQGQGLARTGIPDAAKASDAAASNLPRGSQSNPTGSAAGGGAGGPPEATATALGGASGSASDDRSRPTAAPWQSPSWPTAQSAAMRQINANQIDAAYIDLVRDYFSRP